MRTETGVKLEQIHLEYGKHKILRDLSLEVQDGETFGILGRIGAGKTRVLRIIAGLEKPSSGRVSRAGSCSYIFQNDVLIPWLTVAENLRLCLRDKSVSRHELSNHPVVQAWDVAAMLDKKPHQLSGGMRKKVNLARGFLNSDPLILMDEPFGALDPAQKADLHSNALKSLAGPEATAILVTHDVQEALLFCDRVALLSIKSGNIVRVLQNPFRGRLDVTELFQDGRYRDLTSTAMNFYREEMT